MFSRRWEVRQYAKEKSREAWTCTARWKSRGINKLGENRGLRAGSGQTTHWCREEIRKGQTGSARNAGAAD